MINWANYKLEQLQGFLECQLVGKECWKQLGEKVYRVTLSELDIKGHEVLGRDLTQEGGSKHSSGPSKGNPKRKTVTVSKKERKTCAGRVSVASRERSPERHQSQVPKEDRGTAHTYLEANRRRAGTWPKTRSQAPWVTQGRGSKAALDAYPGD